MMDVYVIIFPLCMFSLLLIGPINFLMITFVGHFLVYLSLFLLIQLKMFDSMISLLKTVSRQLRVLMVLQTAF